MANWNGSWRNNEPAPDDPPSFLPRRQGPIMPKVDTSALPHGISNRVRDEAYRRYVAAQPCLICASSDVQAAHESYGNYARSLKAGDDLCMPLCVEHHREHDQKLGPRTFWASHPHQAVQLIKEALRARYRQWVADGKPKS